MSFADDMKLIAKYRRSLPPLSAEFSPGEVVQASTGAVQLIERNIRPLVQASGSPLQIGYKHTYNVSKGDKLTGVPNSNVLLDERYLAAKAILAGDLAVVARKVMLRKIPAFKPGAWAAILAYTFLHGEALVPHISGANTVVIADIMKKADPFISQAFYANIDTSRMTETLNISQTQQKQSPSITSMLAPSVSSNLTSVNPPENLLKKYWAYFAAGGSVLLLVGIALMLALKKRK